MLKVEISPHIYVTNTSPHYMGQGLMIASGSSSCSNIYVGSRRQAYIVHAPKWAKEDKNQHIYSTQQCYAPINSLYLATYLNHNTLTMGPNTLSNGGLVAGLLASLRLDHIPLSLLLHAQFRAISALLSYSGMYRVLEHVNNVGNFSLGHFGFPTTFIAA